MDDSPQRHRGHRGIISSTHSRHRGRGHRSARKLEYRGLNLDCGYRLDILVEQSVIIEVKTSASAWHLPFNQRLTVLQLWTLPLCLCGEIVERGHDSDLGG
ncbi:MAG: GxxExxY protein [Gemmatimonadales bacterium]